MIPLHDDNPTILRPYVTVGLIVACTLIFLWQVTRPEMVETHLTVGLGFIPAVFLEGRSLPPALEIIPWPLTILSSMFLHGGWMHLIGNMLYLWVFGNNVEDSMGHGRFVAFYLLCGAIAALAHGLSDTASTLPMVGASGAISGVLGAYVRLYPHARILVLIPLPFLFWTARLPALIVLGLWFLFQFAQAAGADASEDGVAFWAHVGGFVAGLVLIHLFRRRPPAPPAADPAPPDSRRGRSIIPSAGGRRPES